MAGPNILLIITDSQGSNLLGATGAGHIHTPNIDRLAASGMRMDRAYNVCPLCTPARSGLFTGQYPQVGGAWSNDVPLGTATRTMGEYFRRRGYDAAYIGKWHLDGTDYFGTGICPPGWDGRYWYDGRNYLDEMEPDERAAWRTGLRSPEAIRNHGITRDWTWAGRITEKARAFIGAVRRSRERKPYLLVVSYDEPHGPSVCPPPFCDMYADFRYPLPANYRDTLEGKPLHHRRWADSFSFDSRGLSQGLYFGSSSFVDDEIGRVIDAADAYDRENTVVIFTTDHGHYLGAHHLDGKGPALYEEVVRVPFIVRGPGVPAGSSSTALMSHVDVVPTLLDLAGIQVPPVVQGVSQKEAWFDPGRRIRDWVFCSFHRFSVTHDSWFGFIPVRSIITESHKLTVNLPYTDELYDLASDPGEMTNLISEPHTADLRDELHRRLLDVMNRTRDPFRGPGWVDRPWSRLEVPSGIGGVRRPRPDDGFNPPTYNYETGMPAQRG